MVAIGLWVVLRVLLRPAAGAYRLAGPILVGAAMLFLIFGGETRDRVFDAIVFKKAENLPFDYRVTVYQDTAAMIAAQPWRGVGLGNFAELFPRYQEVSSAGIAILHPESDWLWLAAELGWPGLAAGLAALVGLLLCSGSLRHGPMASHRLAVLAALSVLLLHSLVDVGGHHLSLIGLALLLASLLISPRAEARPLRLPYPFWRWSGLVLALAGALWLAGALFALPTHTTVVAERSREALQRFAEREDPAAVAHAAAAWTAVQPVSWRPWFAWGRAHLRADGEPATAERAFRISRFLQPEVARLPYLEGVSWIGHDLGRTLDAWRYALNGFEANRPQWLGRMAALGMSRPALREGMIGLARLDPALRANVYPKLDDAAFRRTFGEELANPASLQEMPREQLLRFARRYVALGEGEALLSALAGADDRLPAAWQLRAIGLAGMGDPKAAMDLARDRVDRPPLPAPEIGKDLLNAQREWKNDPTDPLRGVRLFRLQIERSLWSEALETSAELLELPDCPPFIAWWRGEILYAREDYRAAWTATARYLETLAAEQD
jgi:O-antigen ligase